MGDTVFATGKVGQAFSFDGVNDYVEVPHDASLDLPQFSVDAWVFIDPALNSGQFNAFVGKSNGSNSAGGFWLVHDDRNPAEPSQTNALQFAVLGGPSGFSITSVKNAFPSADFYHIAATFDGSQPRLYLNGTLAASGRSVSAIAFNTLPLRIGAINLQDVFGFQGVVDEVELFDRALAQGEIQAIFNAESAGKCRPSVPFSDFSLTELEVEFNGPDSDSFKLEAGVALGESSDGIDPQNEEIVVSVGTSQIIIPRGSFTVDDDKFEFVGTIATEIVEMELVGSGPREFQLKVEVENTDLTDTPNPLKVSLSIGMDSGEAIVRLEGELELESDKD